MFILKVLKELKELVREAGANYTDEELMKAITGKGSIRCGLLPSWNIRKDHICQREAQCKFKSEATKDIRCALRLVKVAGELRKKYWLEEVL